MEDCFDLIGDSLTKKSDRPQNWLIYGQRPCTLKVCICARSHLRSTKELGFLALTSTPGDPCGQIPGLYP
jgi:hypothetical protein